jgi:hypothetical protein
MTYVGFFHIMPPRRSRSSNDSKDAFSGTTTPDNVAYVFSRTYGERAGAEALLNAFLCERNRNPGEARFWIEVYQIIGP